MTTEFATYKFITWYNMTGYEMMWHKMTASIHWIPTKYQILGSLLHTFTPSTWFTYQYHSILQKSEWRREVETKATQRLSDGERFGGYICVTPQMRLLARTASGLSSQPQEKCCVLPMCVFPTAQSLANQHLLMWRVFDWQCSSTYHMSACSHHRRF